MSCFQLVLGTMPLVDNFAHTFGFAMGLVSSLALLKRFNDTQYCAVKFGRRFMRLVVYCCLFVVFAGAVGLMYGVDGHDANELCPQCSKISCVPFPWGCEAQATSGSSSCWWTCSTSRASAPCAGQASFIGQAS